MEPWFRWSWSLGIKPVHPNGWKTVGVAFLLSVPLMLGAVGAFGEQPVLQALSSIAFVAVGLLFFWLVYSRLEGRSD